MLRQNLVRSPTGESHACPTLCLRLPFSRARARHRGFHRLGHYLLNAPRLCHQEAQRKVEGCRLKMVSVGRSKQLRIRRRWPNTQKSESSSQCNESVISGGSSGGTIPHFGGRIQRYSELSIGAFIVAIRWFVCTLSITECFRVTLR